MTLLAQLQNNSVYTKNQAKNAYHELTSQPMQFLAATPLTVHVGNGTHTGVSTNVQFDFNQRNNRLHVSTVGAPQLPPSAIAVTALTTPTRVAAVGGTPNPHRTSPVHSFAPDQGGAKLWLTDQQTGCTVLVLDWGGNQYSMLHLLPHVAADFGTVARFLMNLSQSRARVGGNVLRGVGEAVAAPLKNQQLRQEADWVVGNTVATNGGGQPQRYIMVQSQHALNRLQCLQVIGVANGGWNFFVQKKQVAGAVTVAGVTQLQWRPWADKYYRTY
jgi:hypothetical protein